MKTHKITIEFSVKAKDHAQAVNFAGQAIADGYNAISGWSPDDDDSEKDFARAMMILGSASAPPERTIVVEVSGGVVQDVHGLKSGDQWALADWDDSTSKDRGNADYSLNNMKNDYRKDFTELDLLDYSHNSIARARRRVRITRFINSTVLICALLAIAPLLYPPLAQTITHLATA